MKKRHLGCWVVVGVLGAVGAQRKARPVPNTCAGVVEAAGKPVERAALRFAWLAHPELPRGLHFAVTDRPTLWLRTKSKAKGRFRVGLPHRGPFAVYAEHGEMRSAIEFPVFAGDFFTLRLVPKQYIEGQVVDTANQPVAGASVAKERGASWATATQLLQHPYVSEVVKTDAAGRFRLPVWPVGERPTSEPRSLCAWTDDLATSDSFYFNTGQVAKGLQLVLKRPARHRGTARYPSGKPVAGAHVFDPFFSGRSVRADQDGRYDLKGAPAQVLSIRGPKFWRVSGKSHRLVNAPRPISLTLQHPKVDLAGRRVVFAAPVGAQAHVPWVQTVGKGGALVLDSLPAKTPLSGFLEFEGRFVPFLNRIPTGARLEVQVDTDRGLRGRVFDAKRRPVARAEVLIQPLWTDEEYALLGNPQNPPTVSPMTLITLTDRAGRYQFDNVWPGPLLVFLKAGSQGAHLARVAADHQGSFDITIPEGVRVEGTVAMPNGKPAAHAVIQYITLFDGLIQRFAKRYGMCYLYVPVDAKGRFVITGLPAHKAYTCYALHAHNGEGYRSLQTASSLKGKVVRIQHRLVQRAARN